MIIQNMDVYYRFEINWHKFKMNYLKRITETLTRQKEKMYIN
jgi:hypothetical protein